MKNVEAGINALLAKGANGIAGSSIIRGNVLGAERITRAVTSSVDRNVPESAKISESVNKVVEKMGELFTLKDIGKISNKDFATKLTALENEIKNKANTLGEKGFESLKNILRDSNKQITGTSGIEKEFKKYTSEILGTIGVQKQTSGNVSKISGTKKIEPISKTSIFGSKSFDGTLEKSSSVQTVNSKVDFGGVITIKVDAPPGVSQQQLKTYFESEEFKRLIYEYQSQKSKELERTK
jgi:hypothetical protein